MNGLAVFICHGWWRDGGDWSRWRCKHRPSPGDRIHSPRLVLPTSTTLAADFGAESGNEHIRLTGGFDLGVMRFLQTEWHRHERDRNAWEIERAEMKSRIGRLEGDARTSKHLHESLGKHVKILEMALKKEREKVKSLSDGAKVEVPKDRRETAKENLNSVPKGRATTYFGLPPITDNGLAEGVKAKSSYVEMEGEPSNDDFLHPDVRQDTERDKSRIYLGKCSQEVTYHVIPAAQPPPDFNDLELSNHVFSNHQQSQPTLEEVYVQQRQKQQHNNNISMVRETSVNNTQPLLPSFSENPNPGLTRSATQIGPQSASSRDPNEQRYQLPLTAIEGRNQPFDQGPSSTDQQVESVAYTYDSQGRQVPSNAEPEGVSIMEEQKMEDTDGWDFDETAKGSEASSEAVQPHRPDTDAFPNANLLPPKSPPRLGLGSHRRKSSGARRRSEGSGEMRDAVAASNRRAEESSFKVRFALRGHLDVVRSIIFTGGGSPSEPEICTSSDDGGIKRWIIPASYGSFGPHTSNSGNDLDITSYFTHRGHVGSVTALAACPASPNFSNGGRALGDGWVFSGGQDTSVRVWERGRVDPKATLDGHTDAVWALCVLPSTSGSVLGDRCNSYGGPDRILIASGGADGRILIWAVSSPPHVASPSTGSRRGTGGSRRANSISAGSNFPSSPQPSTATSTPFHYTLIHHIVRADSPSPTCISPLSPLGDNFVVSYTDASILVYDTRTGEEVVGMASLETYDGTPSTGVNSVVASTVGFDGTLHLDPNRGLSEEDSIVHGATGSSGGVEGVIISGYEDRYIRFFDANSGMSESPYFLVPVY